MKKGLFFFLCTIILSIPINGVATLYAIESDSLSIKELNEVIINGVKSSKNEPFATTEIERKELDRYSKNGRELPFMFVRTPGVTAWSDNGTGIGTTYMRIRGAGDSRINVTLDGVPLNSPEDQSVFWANMNSYASLLGSVQIQRGLGTSTVGDGAFGGSIVLGSKLPNPNLSAELTTSYGSFGTKRIGGTLSTGTLGESIIIDGAFHHTATEGYIHGTSGQSGSYYGGVLWMPSDKVILRYRNIGNYEHTGQAWNGVTAGNGDLSLMDGCYIDENWNYTQSTGITEYKDLHRSGLGQYNDLYEYIVTGDNGLFVQDTEGNWLTQRYTFKDGSFTHGATDNYWQDHNILSLAWDINNSWSTSLTAHYTYDYGYYEEFRPQNKLTKFGLTNSVNSNGDKVWLAPDGITTVRKSDFIRKKGLEEHTYGAIWNTNYTTAQVELRSGLSMQRFTGDHLGHITYIGHELLSNALLMDGKYTYYDSQAHKNDISSYIKANWHVTPTIHLFTDVQYRFVSYCTDGINDKFIENSDGMSYRNQELDINKRYGFLNPRFGMTWMNGNNKIYALVAMAGREPERNNFTDNGNYPAPKPESMTDYELGYDHTTDRWNVGINLYYMRYRDQFVQTGLLSDIGEKLTTNICNSYRTGVELTASLSPLSWLQIDANAAFSSNRIKDFDEVVESYDNSWNILEPTVIHYDNSTLAFSPTTVLNGFISIHHSHFHAMWHTNFVSRQYLDNSANKKRSIPAYTLTNLSASYTIDMGVLCREVEFGIDINNLFNGHYATNGWVYSAILGSVHPEEDRYYQIGFTPMAGISALGSITIRF